MDPKRFKDAYERLRALDEAHTYGVRPRPHTKPLTSDQLEEKVRDLARYTIELREIVEELFQAIGSRPASSRK